MIFEYLWSWFNIFKNWLIIFVSVPVLNKYLIPSKYSTANSEIWKLQVIQASIVYRVILYHRVPVVSRHISVIGEIQQWNHSKRSLNNHVPLIYIWSVFLFWRKRLRDHRQSIDHCLEENHSDKDFHSGMNLMNGKESNNNQLIRDKSHVSTLLRSHPSNDDRILKSTTVITRNSQFQDLPLEWWERSTDCRLAKSEHQDKIDKMFGSREDLVLLTTLRNEDTVLEPNMFPCKICTSKH